MLVFTDFPTLGVNSTLSYQFGGFSDEYPLTGGTKAFKGVVGVGVSLPSIGEYLVTSFSYANGFTIMLIELHAT